MPTSLSDLIRDIQPDSTVLLFGAGSSVPSNAPTVAAIIEHLADKFHQPKGFSLTDLTDLIEHKTKDRRKMIEELRSLFKNTKPTGGILNLPIYAWKAIYTTNYDTLVEQSYDRKKVPISVYDSNFDFNVSSKTNVTKIFKLHGTIIKDVSFGQNSRIIITGNDYNYTEDYRQHLWSTMKSDLAESNLIIIGSSLADDDIRTVVNQAILLNAQAFSSGRITLLMYQKDEDRALLYEGKGLKVVFSGIDEFFAELGRKSPGPLFDYQPSDSVVDRRPALVPTVVDVSHQIETARANVSRMFNGWPATYADIAAKLTFERNVGIKVTEFIRSTPGGVAILLGASGVGKTTAARQAMLHLLQEGYLCWEHKADYSLDSEEWLEVARALRKSGKSGLLFVDDAHSELHSLNELIDSLVSEGLQTLCLILVSTRNNWRPRSKTPHIFKIGRQIHLSRLDSDEIDRLITLVETSEIIGRIIEGRFAGFTRLEKRRRLVERCQSDMFVCMRNIFATDNFDDIILREYTGLPETTQNIYRLVSALETSGIRVHRQLVIRLLGIPMAATMAILDSLTDIVTEYDVDAKKHIYGWRGRHPVINAIIMKYKYNEMDKIIELFDKVIESIIPTYEIEVRSIVELCNIDTGIARIPDKTRQNILLRKMISVAPGQRVPRHRLIRNLIDIGEYEEAQTEIRIFEKDFRPDGPVARYKINLLVSRAIRTDDLMKEDRITILQQAADLAVTSIRRHRNSAAVFGAYVEVGLNFIELNGRQDVFEDAMTNLEEAEKRLGDPEITRMIRRYDRQAAGQTLGAAAEEEPLLPEIE